MKSGPPLSHDAARAYYDRLGRGLEAASFYEGRAIDDLVGRLDLARATSVFELGFGTGQLAEELLDRRLPAEARYTGVDQSRTMFDLTTARLARFGERVTLRRTDGDLRFDFEAAGFDRFLSTYVLDLLSEDDIRAVLAEARRLLAPGGLLGVVGLTHGEGRFERLFERVWCGVHALRPAWVGGCRPLRLAEFLSADDFELVHDGRSSRLGMASEVMLARAREV